MVARWMQPKLHKMKRERRAWARPLSIRGAGPNWANGVQFRNDTSLDLNVETQVRNEQATRKMPFPELADLAEIRRNIDDPLFVDLLNNSAIRGRLFFNASKTCFIIQQVEWRKMQVSLSISYPTFTRAYAVWLSDKVRWRITKPIAPRVSVPT